MQFQVLEFVCSLVAIALGRRIAELNDNTYVVVDPKEVDLLNSLLRSNHLPQIVLDYSRDHDMVLGEFLDRCLRRLVYPGKGETR